MSKTKKDNLKIAAVVVTFNRKKLLKECLQALLSQTRPLDEIIVIDNASSDGTDQMIRSEFPQLTYVRLHENIGGAGGFHEGMKIAYEKGYDWIWLMDDDAEPKVDALEKLIKYIDLPNAIALACLKVNSTGNVLYYHRGFFYFENVFKHIVKPISKLDYYNKNFLEIDHASFVGILVNSKAVREIGFPDRRFFIHFDDVEYCIRLRRVGKIYLIPDSIIIHKEDFKRKDLIKKKFIGKIVYRVPYDKFWKSYYSIRNLTYLGKLYSKNKLRFIYEVLKHYIISIRAIIFFDDHKFRRIIFTTSAYLDGLMGRFDNKKPKKILYGK